MSESPSLSPWIVATRRSMLALAQCRAWMRSFEEAAPVSLSELHVVTSGDRIQDRSLQQIGGKGLFIKEIEEAMLEGRAHLAVHSLKDVPAQLAPGLRLAAIPKREDPRDAWIARDGKSSLMDLPKGSKVGTSSLRRVAQLRALRPDLEYIPFRGNVDTRLKKCHDGEVEAIVLAVSGLKRLNMADVITEYLSEEWCIPAVGQGALAIEIADSNEALAEQLLSIHHAETALCVAVERGVMAAVDGSCQLPIGAYARLENGGIRVSAFYAPDAEHAGVKSDGNFPLPTDEIQAKELGLQIGSELKNRLG